MSAGTPVTTVAPKGSKASRASFRLAMPNGIPMMVMKKMTASKTWNRASHQPIRMSQTTFPIADQTTEAPGSVTTVLPNGHKT
jgi:hypothetical protein